MANQIINLNVGLNEYETISLDSNERLNLSFEEREPEPKHTALECFKTIYANGRTAE